MNISIFDLFNIGIGPPSPPLHRPYARS